MIVTLPSFLHPLNAPAPIETVFLPKVTVASFVQPENALAPIFFTLVPMVRLLTFLFFCIAFDRMDVTLYLTPSVPETVLITTFVEEKLAAVSSTSEPALVTR